MPHTYIVVTVLMAILRTSQLAPSGMDPLEPIEIPYPFQPVSYQSMRSDIKLEVGASSKKIPTGDELLEIEYKNDQSKIISKYLNVFDETWKKTADGKSTEGGMYVIKLLIAHSWLYSFEPKKEMLTGIIPVQFRDVSVENLRKYVVIKLKESYSKIQVSDIVLIYANGVHQQMAKEFRTQNENYDKAYNSILDEMSRIPDGNQNKELDKDREAVSEKKKLYKLYLEFHQISLKMCLQSYVLIFIDEPYGEIFELSSSNGLDTKAFDVPPLGRDQFELLIFETELEDEEPFGEPDFGIRLTDEKQMNETDFKIVQNVLLSKYFITFEGIRKKNKNIKYREALITVRMLIMQSWIYMLKPELELLSNFFNVDEYRNVENIEQELKRRIREEDKKQPLADTLLSYHNSLKQIILEGFDLKIKTLEEIIRHNKENLGKETNPQKKETISNQFSKNFEKLEELEILRQFHKVTFKMCLQSYVLDLFDPPYGTTIVVTGSKGQKEEFAIPPLSPNSLFDELSYSISLDN